MAIGTQPPCSILMMFAENSVRSIARKASVSGRMCQSDQFQRPRATT